MTSTQSIPTPAVATASRPRLTTFVLAIAVLTFSLMQTLTVPALPTIGAELGATGSAGWILTAFLLSGAVMAPVIGNLGDRLGHRRVLLAVFVVFAAASLVAAFAPNFGVLLLMRVIQGVSTATFPLALAIARQALPADRLAPALGWLSGMIGLGAGAALVIGGAIVDALGWRWLFGVGAILIVASAVLLAVGVPRQASAPVARPTDWAGIVLLAGGLVGVLLAVSQGAAWGWTSPATLIAGLAGVVLLVLLVLVEMRVASPLVDVRTFRHGPLVAVSILTLAVGFIPYICYVALPLLMQGSIADGAGLGLSVAMSGLAMLPCAAMVFLGGRLAPALSGRIGAGLTAVLAAALMGVGGAGIALGAHSAWAIVATFSVLGLGNGIGYAICAQLVMLWSPADETGAATGLNSVVRTIGSAAAAPVVAALLAAGALTGPEAALPYSLAFWVAAGASLLGVAAACALLARPRRTA